jgi:TPR repeat protein
MRSGKLSRAALFGALSLFLGSTAADAADFHSGLDAYNVGDYTTAFSNWWPLSVEGDARSQAALGFLYYMGLGVRADPVEARVWLRRGADGGQPTAQFLLGLLYLDGRGVKQDYVRAHMWCDLAVSNGFDSGLGCREEAALNMSSDDFARANSMEVEWRRKQAAAK